MTTFKLLAFKLPVRNSELTLAVVADAPVIVGPVIVELATVMLL